MEHHEIFAKVQKASRKLAQVDDDLINSVLRRLAEEVLAQQKDILDKNKKDLELMDPSHPKYDRLLLHISRLEAIASDIRKVAELPSPLHKILETKQLPNGLFLEKITVPLGVIGIVYEARPNVTFDCFSLALKSGNAVLLKGGADAWYSNQAIIQIIHKVLRSFDLDTNIAYLLPPDRKWTEALLQATGWVDIIIPRGSQGLIDYVRQTSKVPVIETGAGIVHAYFDISGNTEIGKYIVFNSKTRRVSVCNALDCLLIHKDRLSVLPEIVEPLGTKNVHIFADEAAISVLKDKYPNHLLSEATETHYGTEFLDYKMAIKTVCDLEEALEHIEKYSSKHSETIIAENKSTQETFLNRVDAAVVYSNVSTAFTDGAQFGMGAEIGISTQKLHARGPMALPELTSYKWVVRGNGQIRD